MDTNTVKNVETLAAFLGPRDLRTLSPDALQEKYGIEQADVMVLFGGSILEGAAVLAEGMEQKLAKHYVIVGGAGHTTEALREQVRKLEPELECAGCSEAEIFNQYLEKRYGRRADFWKPDPPTAAIILRICSNCWKRIRSNGIRCFSARTPRCRGAWKPDCADRFRRQRLSIMPLMRLRSG